jgi:hypothetical protein
MKTRSHGAVRTGSLGGSIEACETRPLSQRRNEGRREMVF